MKHLFKLDNQPSVAVINEILEGWTVVKGSPSMKTWILHTATPGTYHATYAEYEFVHLIEGRITITPDGGQPMDVGPGDAFVVDVGFKGTWEIKESVVKHFDIKL